MKYSFQFAALFEKHETEKMQDRPVRASMRDGTAMTNKTQRLDMQLFRIKRNDILWCLHQLDENAFAANWKFFIPLWVNEGDLMS